MSLANPFQYEDPNQIDAIAGVPESNSCPILIFTIHDPAINTVTFTCNGVTYTDGVDFTVNMTAIGLGKSGVDQVGWTGKVTVTGLSGFTKYPWTVSQGSNSNVGSFYNSPLATDDFRILWGNCDVCNIANGYLGVSPQEDAQILFEANAPHFVHGIWPYYRQLAEQTDVPTTITLFVDDWAYFERGVVNDTDGNTGFNHQPTVPPFVLTGNRFHDYALAMFNALGFCGTTDSTSDPGYKLWGRQVDRAWCRRNTSFAFQWGDHEFKNDFGFDAPVTSGTYPNPMHESASHLFDGAAKVTFDAFFGHIRPTLSNVSIPADADANHWSIAYGALTIACPDAITNGSGGMKVFGTTPAQGTQLGLNQIDDLRESIQTIGSDITLIGMPVGLRYVVDDAAYPSGLQENNCGDQHPLFDHTASEFQRLFTDTVVGGDESMMNDPQTNGASGNLMVWHGDHHRAHVFKFEAAAYTNNAEESFYMFGAGTINGMGNFGISAGLINESAAGISIEYDPSWDYTATDVSNGHNYHGLYGTVYGSKNTTRMDVHMINESGNDVWSGKTFSGYGNRFFAIDEIMPNITSVTEDNTFVSL